MTAILELLDIRAAYGQIEVLHGINVTVEPGKVLAVLGPNGAGKTTLVRVISGLLRPTDGRVIIAGRDVTGVSGDALARAGVCVIQEGRGIFPRLTVGEHMRLAMPRRRRAPDLLERVYEQFPQLAERQHQVAGTLSGGEQQMLALSRALIWNPPLLVIDELSMGLAPRVVDVLYQTVQAFAEQGTTIVVIEQFAHDILGFADQAIVLQQGKVVRTDTPAAVAKDLAELYLAATPSGS
ncbi:MAG TPA: ABC transporter ATP-binding protein [Trebonia sp.]|jgi:branched-chain amino acid transport system ATP-binding protein|nr:ABC transporter ATP-binding protein [Trebonia sp.]